MFSKPTDHPKADSNFDDSQLELSTQKNTRILHTPTTKNIPTNDPESNGKGVSGIQIQLPSALDAPDQLATIQKASGIITQNLPVHQIIQTTLEICREIVPFSSGDILLNHAGKWEPVQKKDKEEFEIILTTLRNEGLVEMMCQEKRYFRSSTSQLRLNDSDKSTGEIFLFPMIVDSQQTGVCILVVNEENSNLSVSDLETISMIVDQAAIALKYGETQKQLSKQERILDNFKQLLIRALKMVLVGELAKGITHEINNPLQIILGKIQMATIGMNHQDALKHVEKQSLQIASLVRTISDISKNRTGDSMDIIEINSFLEHTIGLIRGQIEKRGIEIHLNLNKKSMPIHSNHDYLRQLILNSALNAKKRMASGGQFTISTNVIDDSTIQIEFKDDGSKLEGNFNKTILNYAVEMDKLNQLNVDLGEITNILLVRELGGVIDYQSHESFGNKILIRIPQNRQDIN